MMRNLKCTPGLRARQRLGRLLLALGCWAAGPALALPMASQGFWMVMGDARFGDRPVDDLALSANYALTGRDAFGAAVARFGTPGHEAGMAASRRETVTLTYTRLVNRWNLPHAQANLWFVAEAGGLRAQGVAGGDGTRTMWSPAVLADWETTRLYLGGGLKTQRADDWRRDTAYARAGFSFYEVEYEEIQPWFILEVKRERERYPMAMHAGHTVRHSAAETEWMPMLRFIHRRWFVEIGARGGDAHLSFMYVP